jgi:hypothetical protein
MKHLNDANAYQTRNLPVCSAVHQQMRYHVHLTTARVAKLRQQEFYGILARKGLQHKNTRLWKYSWKLTASISLNACRHF